MKAYIIGEQAGNRGTRVLMFTSQRVCVRGHPFLDPGFGNESQRKGHDSLS